ncbi:MAG: hypothetical protein CME19_20570 [Gemmatimonadetes bacterium]|nr:hypothetical protein [Gemmatimonadota bacterium]
MHVPEVLRKWLPLIALAVIYVAIGHTKAILTFASPYYRADDETNLHFTENAIQYRLAKLVGTGDGIPEVDTRLQHPEGVRVAEELTVTLERVSGTLYRFLQISGYDTPFHTYSVYFIAFWSSLAVIPLYLIGSRLYGGPIGGLIVVAFYVVMPPAWMRSITSFSREDFALTFLFTGLSCFGLSIGRQLERWMPWVAGVALSIAAVSWHISGFVLAILFTYSIAVSLLDADGRQALIDSLWPVVATLFVAGLASDLLRNKWFVLSTTMLIGYGILLSHVISERYRLSLAGRVAILIGFPMLAHLGLSAAVGENYRAYSHAFDVIEAKLRFGLVKPVDPTLMSHDARGMWSSSFMTPSLGNVWAMLSTLLLVSIGAAFLSARDLRARVLPRTDVFILYCFVAFLGGYILFDRLQVFFVFFAALITGRWLIVAGDYRRIAIPALCALIGYEIYNDTRLYITVHRTPGLDRLVGWVREHTKPDDVILAAFQVSPSILAYTDRPIVLHPKFESHVIREKNQSFQEGLFGPEKSFYERAKSWKADYYVYQASTGLDTSLESVRYNAGYTQVPHDAVLFSFHFAPDQLEHFHLIYQDSYYRVYAVGDQPADLPDLAYQPAFDLRLFSESGGMPSDEQITRVRGQLGNPQMRARLAPALVKDGRYAEGAVEFARLAAKRPQDAGLQLAAANAYERAGQSRRALRHYLLTLRANPGMPMVRFETENGMVFRDGARLLLELGRADAGLRWLERAVDRLPEDAEAATNLGILYGNGGQLEDARRLFERVASMDMDYPPVDLQLGLLNQKEGRHREAIERLERYLAKVPGSPQRRAIRDAIRASRGAIR